jgi:hypothetical protein
VRLPLVHAPVARDVPHRIFRLLHSDTRIRFAFLRRPVRQTIRTMSIGAKLDVLSGYGVLRSTKGSDEYLVCIDGNSKASHAHWVGIEILFESEFDPAVEWAT